MIKSGDILTGLPTADGGLRAVPVEIVRDGGQIVRPMRTADGHEMAVRWCQMEAAGDFGPPGATADGHTVGLAPCLAAGSCAPPIDLGFGLRGYLYPGHNLTFGSGAIVHLPGQTAMWHRVMADIAGEAFGGIVTHNPEGLAGDWEMANWIDPAGLPFLTLNPIPQRTIGSAREIPGVLAQGMNVLYLGNEAPTSGIWFGSLIRPFVIDRRWFRTGGPWTAPAEAANLWNGLGPPDMPLDIATSSQVFACYSGQLELNEAETQLTLTLRLYVVAVVGRQMDFDWSVPVTITTQEISCPADGLLELGDDTDCGCTLPNAGLGEIGCHCVCEDPGAEMTTCQLLEPSINNIRQGGCLSPPCNTLPYAACQAGHKDYLTEVYLTGEASQSWTADWEPGQPVRLLDVLLAFGPHLGTHSGLSSMLAAGFRHPAFSSIAVQHHAEQRPTTGAEIVYNVAPQAVQDEPPAGETTHDGDGTPLRVSLAEHPIPYCTPSLRSVFVSRADGYIAWVLDQFRGMLTREEAYYAGTDNDLDARILADPYISNLAKTTCVTSDRGAMWYACRMLAARLSAQNLIDTFATEAGARAATEMTDVPLLTSCYPGTASTPPGVDPKTNEGVFGYLGPLGSWCPSLFAMIRVDGQCIPHDMWNYSITELAECAYIDQFGSMLKPPDMPEGYNGTDVCHFPGCWREVARGGFSRICTPFQTSAFCDLNPDHPLCWQSSGGYDPADMCAWLWQSNRMKQSDEWPRFYAFAVPWLEVRVRIEGCTLHVRAQYMTWILRGMRCWSTAHNPDQWDNYLTTFFGYLRVGRGETFEAPVGVTAPLGAKLPRKYWTRAQSEPFILAGCQGTPPPRVDIEAAGNTLAIEL